MEGMAQQMAVRCKELTNCYCASAGCCVVGLSVFWRMTVKSGGFGITTIEYTMVPCRAGLLLQLLCVFARATIASCPRMRGRACDEKRDWIVRLCTGLCA